MTQRRWMFWGSWAAFAAVGSLVIMIHRVSQYPSRTIVVGGWSLPTFSETHGATLTVPRYNIGFLDNDKIGYVAVRPLRPNHRLIDGDFERADLPSSFHIRRPAISGRYVVRDIPAGAVVDRRNTRLLPVLEVDSGKALVAVPVAQDVVTAGVVGVGTHVIIIGGTHQVSGEVRAIIGQSPLAVIEVTAKDAAVLAPTSDKPPKLVVIPRV